jgi:hypothetical protein
MGTPLGNPSPQNWVRRWMMCCCRPSDYRCLPWSGAQKRVRIAPRASRGTNAKVRTRYPYTCGWARYVYVYGTCGDLLPRRNGYASPQQARIRGRRNRYGRRRCAVDVSVRRIGYAAETGTTGHFWAVKSVYAESGSLLAPSSAETGTQSRRSKRSASHCVPDSAGISACGASVSPCRPPIHGLARRNRYAWRAGSCGKACGISDLSPQIPVRALR